MTLQQIFFSEVFSPNDQLANLLLELEEQFRYELTVSDFTPPVSRIVTKLFVC